MKALVMMLIRRLYTADAWLAFLDQDEAVAVRVRPLVCEPGRLPSRRTWDRRLAVLPTSLPGMMGSGGRSLVALWHPWARHRRAVASDRTPLATGGGVWHKTPRAQGMMPPSALETEAGGSNSGWHGWWDGWKLPLAVTVGSLWIPLAAELTVANRGDKAVAPWLLKERPGDVRYVLGDTHDTAPERRQQCHRRGCELVATRRGPSPHRDGGVEVRNMFPKLRSQAIEPFNGLFKNVLAWRVTMPVQGWQRAPLLA
jgi:hypothetical protein